MERLSRILCINPALVPIADSEAFCGAKMTLALMSDGLEVKSIYMTRDDPWLLGRHEKSEVWNPVLAASVGVTGPTKKEAIKSMAAAIRYMTDSWARWVERVMEESAKLHQDNPFDIVYSRSLPAVAHIAGYWVSKNLKLPWIANINDPWDFHLFPNVHRKASVFHKITSKIWLRRTLQKADLVTYPSSWLREYTGNLAGGRYKGDVIPHIGWRAQKGISNNYFTLVHAGKIGVSEVTGRSALGLLNGVKRFFNRYPEAESMTKIFFVGPSDPQTELLIEEMNLKCAVTFTGWVSYEESLKLIGEASACILIEAKMAQGIYFPSKLADYIVSEKPVLAVSPGIGTIADLSGEWNGIIRCNHEDDQAIEDAIAKLYWAFKNGKLNNFNPPADLIGRFQAKNVSALFQKLVRDNVEFRSEKGRSDT